VGVITMTFRFPEMYGELVLQGCHSFVEKFMS
jgi:hypothetical protein